MNRRRIVIDADILRSAGLARSDSETAVACRSFLECVKESRHYVTLSPEILAEWRRHTSVYAATWLVEMRSRRRIHFVEPEGDGGCRVQLEELVADEYQMHRMDKDMHLVEAALISDRLIASRDESVRSDFRMFACDIRALSTLTWVNPCVPEDEAMDWLKAGAPSERHRFLCPRRVRRRRRRRR